MIHFIVAAALPVMPKEQHGLKRGESITDDEEKGSDVGVAVDR